eukprot:scaffold297259_cov45-Attheya_sp.AAC.2
MMWTTKHVLIVAAIWLSAPWNPISAQNVRGSGLRDLVVVPAVDPVEDQDPDNPLKWVHETGEYFQGDMRLSFQQAETAFGVEVANSAAAKGELFDIDPSNFVPGDGDGRDLALISGNFWTIRNPANNKVQIPYAFVSGDFSASQETNIVGWLNEMNVECPVEFIARTTEAHYVKIQSSDSGCYSYVGNVGAFAGLSPQPLNLAYSTTSTCVFNSVVKHEFLHAAGFYHEQS